MRDLVRAIRQQARMCMGATWRAGAAADQAPGAGAGQAVLPGPGGHAVDVGQGERFFDHVVTAYPRRQFDAVVRHAQ